MAAHGAVVGCSQRATYLTLAQRKPSADQPCTSKISTDVQRSAGLSPEPFRAAIGDPCAMLRMIFGLTNGAIWTTAIKRKSCVD